MNRQSIKKLSYRSSRLLPMAWIRQLSKQSFIFPFYHLVSDAPSPLVKHLYPVRNKKQFEEDLDYLLRHFRPADFQEVLEFSKQRKAGIPRFFLSFDDGLKECYDTIAPLLKKKGVPAAFFVNPAFVGNKKLQHRQKISLLMDKVLNEKGTSWKADAENLMNIMLESKNEFIYILKKLTFTDTKLIDKLALKLDVDFAEEARKYKPFMGVEEIRQLQQDGFIIGSHSYDHSEFSRLSMGDMKKQVIKSFQFLDANLKISHRVFSFPFHDIGVPQSFFNFLQQEANVALSFGTSGIKNDEAPGHIHRIPMEVAGFQGARSIIRSEYFYYLGKSFFGKNLVKRR